MIEILLALTLMRDPTCLASGPEIRDLWASPGQNYLYMGPVPDDQVWLINAASVFTNNRYDAKYMLSVARQFEGRCCKTVNVARTPGPVKGTPLLALGRSLILYPGDFLKGRANRVNAPYKFGINMHYLTLPARCLAGGTP